MVPIVDLRGFSYNVYQKRLVAEASALGIPPGRFPTAIDVYSHHSDRTVRWTFDSEAAARAEWWDGEEAHYRTDEPRVRAKTLVIFND